MRNSLILLSLSVFFYLFTEFHYLYLDVLVVLSVVLPSLCSLWLKGVMVLTAGQGIAPSPLDKCGLTALQGWRCRQASPAALPQSPSRAQGPSCW